MPSILFVCTANQLRSPIAARKFQQLCSINKKSRWTVESAGTWTDNNLTPPKEFLALGEKVGVSLVGHETTAIETIELTDFDWIVVMEHGHFESMSIEFPEIKKNIHMLTALAGAYPSDIPDPSPLDGKSAAAILTEMITLVEKVYKKIAH